MKKHKLILLLLLLFFFHQLYAQDTLVLINGKQKTDIEFMKIQDDYIYYQKWNGDKNKIKLIAREQVYAIYTKEGQQIVTYKQDSLGFILNEAKMFVYVEGMADAWNSYQNPYVLPLAFVVSAGAGIWPGVPLGLVVPVAFPAIMVIKQPKTNTMKQIPANKIGNYYYVLGYQDVAKDKKIRSSVFGSLLGYAVGAAINILFLQ